MKWKYGYDYGGYYNWKKREEFADRHGRKCAACGKENLVSRARAEWVINKLHEEFDNPQYLARKEKEWKSRIYQIDHIVPKAKGGTDDDHNLQLLCWSCNAAKGTRSMEEFKHFLDQRQELPKLAQIVSNKYAINKSILDKVIDKLTVNEAYDLFSKIAGDGQ
jgi:hypothetical protein